MTAANAPAASVLGAATMRERTAAQRLREVVSDREGSGKRQGEESRDSQVIADGGDNARHLDEYCPYKLPEIVVIEIASPRTRGHKGAW